MSAHEIILERVEVFDGVLDMYFSYRYMAYVIILQGHSKWSEIVLDEALQMSSIPSRINIGKPYPNPSIIKLKSQ